MSTPKWIVLDANEFFATIVCSVLSGSQVESCEQVASEIEWQLTHGPGVVVIDPEDEADVHQLILALKKSGYVLGPRGGDAQAALRSLLPTTRPPEPEGRYAVVEDGRMLEWVRADLAGDHPWHSIDGGNSCWKAYADITAVKVLNEGVVTP